MSDDSFVVRPRPDEPGASCGPDPALERIREVCAPRAKLAPEDAERVMEGIRTSVADCTNGTEGGGMLRFNTGKHRMTLVPASFGRYTAAVLEYGAIKYDTNNWRKGGSWSSAIDSLTRHLDAFREGEDYDAESTLPHLAHLAFNVMILIEFFDKQRGQDDRFRYPGQLPGEQLPTRELTFVQPPKKEEA